MLNNSESNIVYVGNISQDTTKDILKSAFITFGEIKSIEIPFDTSTQKQKGFAFVEFEDYEDCWHAIDNLNESELCGMVIKVSFAKPQKLKQEMMNKPIWNDEKYLQEHHWGSITTTGNEKAFE